MLPIKQRAVFCIGKFSIVLLILAFAIENRSVAAQQNGISSPAAGETLSGVVEVMGTAVHPAYLRYELAFLREDAPGATWIVFAEGSNPVQAGTLASWDTTVGRDVGASVFPDGRYQLRLRVVKNDYNYDEYFVTNLTIVNSGPTPVPTPDETAVALTATVPANPVDPQTTGAASSFQQLTPLPSLTPFPTPTALATAVGSQTNSNTAVSGDNSGGVIGQLQEVDTNRFSEAFINGIRITVVIFVLLAHYLLIRQVGRRLWRRFWARKNS
jgi:hypothetical protein